MISKSISWSTWMTVCVESESERSRSAGVLFVRSLVATRARRLPTRKQQTTSTSDHEQREQRATHTSDPSRRSQSSSCACRRRPRRWARGLSCGARTTREPGIEQSRLSSASRAVYERRTRPRRRRETQAGWSGVTFLRTLEETLGRGMGLSDSPTSAVECNRGAGQLSLRSKLASSSGSESAQAALQSVCLPSIMFLMRTERLATSFSTGNCSLSEL